MSRSTSRDGMSGVPHSSTRTLTSAESRSGRSIVIREQPADGVVGSDHAMQAGADGLPAPVAFAGPPPAAHRPTAQGLDTDTDEVEFIWCDVSVHGEPVGIGQHPTARRQLDMRFGNTPRSRAPLSL